MFRRTTTMIRMTLAAVLVALVAAPAALDAQRTQQREQNAFQWSGQIPTGSWLRLRNINGKIDVVPASGSTAEVTADKTWRRGNPAQVRVEMIRDGNNVTICAIWHENVRCDADGYQGRGRSDDSNDVSVEFTVRLPRDVHLQLNTVNGGLAVEGATAQVRAQTVNGGVRVASTGGPVDARTTNGSITARMGTASLASDVSFRTVNGSISLTLPANFNAELETRTVNGSIQTDFPITMSGRINPRQLRGTLGTGGRRLELHTVNGSIRINRS